MSAADNGKKLKVTLVKGTNSCRADHRATVRGMIAKVGYLVSVAGE